MIAEATGGTVRDASATAALEAAAGSYMRAFAIAEVTPVDPGNGGRLLRGNAGTGMARDLIRRGEFCCTLSTVDAAGMVKLLPAGSWDVRGGWDIRRTGSIAWTCSGRPATSRAWCQAAAVVHGKYSIDPARPWFGISPMGWASLTGRLHASVEDALADESGGTRGHVLPVPAGPDADGDDDTTTDPNADLRADIAALRGKTAMVETSAAGWGEGKQAAPMADWKPQRIGANPPAAFTSLRTDSAQAVLAACGVSADLFVAGDAAGQRESWRRFLHGSVAPVAALLADELATKLDTPGLRLTFDALFASDLSGRARAFQSLVKGGMPVDKAAALAGLMEAE